MNSGDLRKGEKVFGIDGLRSNTNNIDTKPQGILRAARIKNHYWFDDGAVVMTLKYMESRCGVTLALLLKAGTFLCQDLPSCNSSDVNHTQQSAKEVRWAFDDQLKTDWAKGVHQVRAGQLSLVEVAAFCGAGEYPRLKRQPY